jgi:molybdopterin biosynthesis enzyme
MISYLEAISLIDANTPILKPETIGLEDILGRAIACPLVSPFDMPQFDNSSVDGFAVLCRRHRKRFGNRTHKSQHNRQYPGWRISRSKSLKR